MGSQWTTSPTQQNGATPVLLAATPQTAEMWYAVLANEPRLRVVARAVSPEDLKAKLATRPLAVLLEATIATGPSDLIALVSGLSDYQVYVVTPAAVPEDDFVQVKDALEPLPQVKGVFRDTVNLVELTRQIAANAAALREQSGGAWAASGNSGGHARAVMPVRIVGVYLHAGGVGKTTVASNLAFAAARHGIPTLLIGLGAPDDLPLVLGLKPSPNIANWRAQPTPEGLKAALQKRDVLDVLAGFPDVLSEAQAAGTPSDAPNSVRALVDQAIRLGYAAIVLDMPPSALAASALVAVNTLVLVARPSSEGVMRAVETYRTVVERLGADSLLHPQAIRVVLNRVGGRLRPDQWHALATRYYGQAFPALTAIIPDDPAVGRAQDSAEMPYVLSRQFAAAIDALAADLFGPVSQSVATPPSGARRVRVRLPF